MAIWNLSVQQYNQLTEPNFIAARAAPSGVIFCRMAPYGDAEPAQLIIFK